MCGFLGCWWREEPVNLTQTVNNALNELHHRGPDDKGYDIVSSGRGSGVVALGHTRLSIIDLSSAGHQPMYSPDKRYCLVFNGEIYNYKELKIELVAQGHSFRSGSDTEVLLYAWIEWGVGCLVKLVGMFSFVVYDTKEATLTCVRDAFGIKPFFYSIENNSFSFASELAALNVLKGGNPQLNMQRVYDYLVHGDYDSNSYSFIEGVNHLPPASYITFDLEAGFCSKPNYWWKPCIEQRSALSFTDAAIAVRDQFLNDVRLHLRSDVTLGATLSGGVDSSAIVCAMRHLEPDLPIHTFSFIAPGSDVSEEFWVDKVNAYVNAIPHKISVTGEEFINDLDDLIESQGEPFGSTSIYASYRVNKLAKDNGITVTLDGQGADELLAGYSGFSGQRFHSLIDKCEYTIAWGFLKNWSSWPNRNLIGGIKHIVNELTRNSSFCQKIFRRINGATRAPRWLNIVELEKLGVTLEYPSPRLYSGKGGRRVIAELASAITNRGLVSLLRHGDRNSMRFSIESRVPFLTIGMADLLYSLPEEYLISIEGETKSVFREAMRGIVPDEVLSRRDKIGFATPEKDWLFEIATEVRSWLESSKNIPFLNAAPLLEEFDDILSGEKEFSWQVWRWINFIRWMKGIDGLSKG